MAKRLIAMAMFVGVLCAARPSEAAFLDFIWELSGPRLVGFGVGCRWDFNLQRDVCEIGMAPTKLDGGDDLRSKLFFAVGGTYFFSTSKDGRSGVPYGWNDVRMIAIEPSVSMRSVNKTHVRVHHGIGPSYDYLFGPNFKSFDKFGVRVTPLEVVLPNQHVSFAVTARLYPNGFTDDEFGFFNRRNSYNRPFEAVYGFTGGFSF